MFFFLFFLAQKRTTSGLPAKAIVEVEAPH